MGEHRLADHVADRVDVGDVGAQLCVDGDEAALVDLTPAASAPIEPPFGARPTATRTRVERLPARRLRRHVQAVFVGLDALTFVSRWIAS